MAEKTVEHSGRTMVISYYGLSDSLWKNSPTSGCCLPSSYSIFAQSASSVLL